jgi:hypothetical protein
MHACTATSWLPSCGMTLQIAAWRTNSCRDTIQTLFLPTDERGHQTLEGLLTQEACDAAVV